MKKIFVAVALCAGILVFANTDFAEAADQKTTDVTSIQSIVGDVQQLSTEYKEDKD